MKKLRFNPEKFKKVCLEGFLDVLWLAGMSMVTLGVYEILGPGSALITAGLFALGSAYFKTQQITRS